MLKFCFHALQPKWIERDRFYKVYVTEDCIYGAWVAGQIWSWHAAVFQLFIFAPAAFWALRSRKKREALYDQLISAPNALLAHDQRNFAWPRSSIRRIGPTQRYRWWTPGAGATTVTIEFHHDSFAVDLLVVTPETSQNVADRLLELGYAAPSASPFAFTAPPHSEEENPYRAPRFEPHA